MKKNKKVKRKPKEERKPKRGHQKEKRIELNSKELKINLEKIQEDLKKAYSAIRKLLPESISGREIKQFRDASHIILPKKYAGKKATVIIMNSLSSAK